MTRDNIIKVARKELGVTEIPAKSNRTKYGEWYRLDGHAWCAMFVSWVFNEAGLPLEKIQTTKGYHHCQGAHNYFKKEGRITTNPQKGDIVLFDWNNDRWADHTGIFVKWANTNKTEFICLEGNTSLGDNRNGGSVMERKRHRNFVKSFASPKVYKNTIDDIPKSVFEIGDRGSEVAEIQEILNDIGYATMADGWYGNKTAASVKLFQEDNLMDETGKVDEVTLGALHEEKRRREVAKSKLVTGAYLRYGDSGYPVTLIQIALNDKGADPKLVVDGQFGRGTSKAVKAFQKKHNLDVDGIVGPVTLKKLDI